jgi:cell division protein FtsI/penicillin-binding protein 2
VNRSPSPNPSWRLLTVALVLAISTAGIIGRLAYLQIVRHDQYITEAQMFHGGDREITAHRGSILDRLGNPLAMSVETFNVLADRKVWSDPDVGRRSSEKLAPLLNRSAQDVLSVTGDADSGPALIALDIPYEQGRGIIAAGIPGVIVEPSSHRINPEGNLAAPLLGFTGREARGLSGLELDLDDLLTGEPGRLIYERDSTGNPIPFGYRQEVVPEPGGDVLLTIDRTIQRMAERELDDAIARTKATGGTIIVQDPRTGAILAMVSRPTFDLEQLDLTDASKMEFYRNRAVTDLYEPGSVFKLMTMAAAIDAAKVNPNTTYVDTGQAVVGERVFANWDFSANGTTTMTNVLVRSLNTGTVWLADKILGTENFYNYVRRFGFGEATGSGLSGEAEGFYRLPTQQEWSRSDLASNSFGQGISVTPLQVVNMVSALANGGSLMRPYFVGEVRRGDGVTVTQPEVVRQAISPQTAATMRAMMKEVVDANLSARVPGYSAGGKSGTAYVPIGAADYRGDAYKDEVTIPSYVGFAPLENPRVTILVKLDNLGSADFGGTLTAPVFSRLAQSILTYLRVPPDRPETITRRTPTPTPSPSPTPSR